MARILVILAAAFGLLPGANAWAHARLTMAVPAADSVVASAPAAVALTFNEPVMLIVCRVLGPDGNEVGGNAKARGLTLEVPLKAGLGAGRYTVNYRVAGDDGHAMAGSISFSVRPAAP